MFKCNLNEVNSRYIFVVERLKICKLWSRILFFCKKKKENYVMRFILFFFFYSLSYNCGILKPIHFFWRIPSLLHDVYMFVQFDFRLICMQLYFGLNIFRHKIALYNSLSKLFSLIIWIDREIMIYNNLNIAYKYIVKIFQFFIDFVAVVFILNRIKIIHNNRMNWAQSIALVVKSNYYQLL